LTEVQLRGEISVFIMDDGDAVEKDADRALLGGKKTRGERVSEDFTESKNSIHGRGTCKSENEIMRVGALPPAR
jgi:hypothetical protein